MKKRHYLYFSFLFSFCVMIAQNITVTSIPMLDQLPVSAIHRIYQDSEGYIWYGTVDGLCRDDGYGVQVFRADLSNPDLLASNMINCITEDKEKKIWFGTSKGVYILDKSNYNISPLKEPGLKDKEIITLHTTSDGSVWVSVLGILFRFDSNKTLLNAYPLVVNGEERTIHCIYEDKNNDILISIWKDDIYKFDKENDCISPFIAIPESLDCTFIIQDKDNPYYWAGTWGKGIVRVDPHASSDSCYVYQPLPVNINNQSDSIVFYMAQDDVYGYIWATSVTDLFVFKPDEKGRLKQIDTSRFLPVSNKMLNEIIKDQDGNLWVSAFDRKSFIVNFRDNNLREYSIPTLKNRIEGNPAIMAICKDEDVFWLSQERIGLCLYDPTIEKLKYYTDGSETKSLDLSSISVIAKSHRKNKVWIAPYTSFLYGMHREGLEMQVDEKIDLTNVRSGPGVIHAIYEDKDNNLWIGTTIGLYTYHTTTGELKIVSDTIGKVSGIIETGDRMIWISTTDKGIYKITPEDKKYSCFPVIKDILCIDKTTDGRIWLGTEQGNVVCFDPVTTETVDYSMDCGMNGDAVNQIIADNYNHIWICTNQKLTEFNPRNGAYRNYLAADEWLLLDRFLPRATFKDSSGEIYLGGIPGFISVKSSNRLESIPRPVNTLITDIKVMGQSVIFRNDSKTYKNTTLEVRPDERNIEINFSSLNHWHAAKVRYAYRLKGVDNDWVYLKDGRNSAFYNQLNKGTYIFQVKATDENGLWSDTITELTIRRLPAFYETWWAYTSYILIILILIWLALYLYLKRIKHENEKKLSERVSQMKLRYFTNISHELLTPLTILSCVTEELETQPDKSHAYVGLLRSNIIRLRRLLQQVLDFRKIEHGKMKLNVSHGNLASFIKDICDTGFSPLSRNKNIEFELHVESGTIEGYFDKDKLDKIVFNLLSNAFKYTPVHGKVWVEVATYYKDKHQFLHIVIGDNGKGIPSKELSNIFTRFYNNRTSEMGSSNGIGLSLTKELIELHHGTITVESEPGKGSIFTVEFPVDKESYSSDELLNESIPNEVVLLPEIDKNVSPDTGIVNLEEGGRYTLLLVEDNEELLKLMENVLSSKYKVLISRNGREALECISNHDIDIIISDVMMPEMDGLELCRRIKNDLNTSHIIVILLTAKTQTEDKLESYRAGADEYISKPFEIRVLDVRLENLLRSRNKRQKDFKTDPQIKITELQFTSLDEQFLEKAIKTVENNLTEPDFDVVKLAELVHMSRSTLSRKIKTTTGLTPLEFIRNIKMKHACRMLEDKNFTVSEVAFTLGYYNRKYFASCFKEEFGMTPSEYQKSKCGD